MTSTEQMVKAVIDNLKVENNYERVYGGLMTLAGALDGDEYEEVAGAIARAGGISVVIDQMQQNPHVGGIQGFGCMILGTLAEDSGSYKRDICEKGGVLLVTAALKHFEDNHIVRTAALLLLGLLSEVAPSSIIPSIPVILSILKNHMDDNETLKLASLLLADAAASTPIEGSAVRRCITSVVNAGGIPILVSSLKSSVTIADSEEFSMRLPVGILLLILFIFESDDNRQWTHRFASEGGFQATFSAMLRWEDDYNIQSSACRVLAAMIGLVQEHEKVAVREAGGIDLILKTIKHFLKRTKKTHDQDLVENFNYSIKALYAISTDSIDAVAAVLRANGLPILVEVFQEAFPHDPVELKMNMHETLVFILHSYVDLSTEQDTETCHTFLSEMIDCGVIPSVLLSMEQHPSSVGIQYDGCAILLKVASGTDNGTTAIVVDGGKKLIERAKAHYVDYEDIQELAEELLEIIDHVEDVDRCHKCHMTSDDLMDCSRCRRVIYCCKDCQRADYKLHKKLCMQMASIRSSSDAA